MSKSVEDPLEFLKQELSISMGLLNTTLKRLNVPQGEIDRIISGVCHETAILAVKHSED